jgi:hypothetical protein
MRRMHNVWIPLLAAVAVACGLNLTGPFEGFDGKGTRLSGRFEDAAAAQASRGPGVALAASARAEDVQGIRVSVRERPSIATTVAANGSFSLVGLPAGGWTIVFERDGQVIGEMSFHSVRSNQEIRIVVSLLDGEVVLLDESRDAVSFDEDCPRGAGFWCQNQGGKNPNLSREEFERFAKDAATLLSSVEALDTAEEIAAAVCDTGDQLRRQLATLALNIASGAVSRDDALTGESFSTVGAALDRAIQLAQQGARSAETNEVKDVLERINEGQSLASCDSDDLPSPSPTPSTTPSTPPTSGKITICHVPPGNPANKHTLTISVSAWPAHQAHGDTMGACTGARK